MDFQQFEKQISSAVETSIDDIDERKKFIFKNLASAKKDYFDACFDSNTCKDTIDDANEEYEALQKVDKYFAYKTYLQRHFEKVIAILQANSDTFEQDLEEERMEYEETYEKVCNALTSCAVALKKELQQCKESLLKAYKEKATKNPDYTIVYIDDAEWERIKIRTFYYSVPVSKFNSKIKGIMSRRAMKVKKLEAIASEKRQKLSNNLEEIVHKAEKDQVVQLKEVNESSRHSYGQGNESVPQLPNDSILEILSWLTLQDAFKIRTVSKHFASLVHTVFKKCWLKSIIISPVLLLKQYNLLWIRKIILWLMYDPALDSSIRNEARDAYIKFKAQLVVIGAFKKEATRTRKLQELTQATMMKLLQWDNGRVFALLFENSVYNTSLVVHMYTGNKDERILGRLKIESDVYMAFLSILTRTVDVSKNMLTQRGDSNGTIPVSLVSKIDTFILSDDCYQKETIRTIFDAQQVFKLKSVFASTFVGAMDLPMIESVDEYHICEQQMCSDSYKFPRSTIEYFWPKSTSDYKQNMVKNSTTYHYMHETALDKINDNRFLQDERSYPKYTTIADLAVAVKIRYMSYVAAGGKLKLRILTEDLLEHDKNLRYTYNRNHSRNVSLFKLFKLVENGQYEEYEVLH